jgi:probable HAF family extracellular repeat protein
MTTPTEALGSPPHHGRRFRWGFAAWTALALLAAAAAPAGSRIAAAETAYDFVLVEAFNLQDDLREVMLRDINEANVVSGTATGGSYAGFYWTLATEKVTVPLTWPQGLNNLGQIVSENRIYDLDDGASIVVPPVGWPIARLLAINDAGVAVGYSECRCSNSGRTAQSPLVWDAAQGSRTIPVAAAKELLRIDSGGLAVGNIRGGASVSEGFRYHVHTGAYANLSDVLPPKPYVRPYSEVQDVAEGGLVCGRGWDGARVRGLVWSSDGTVRYLPAIRGGMIDRVYPRGVNASGVVVGFNDVQPQTPRAFVWDATNGMRDLNDLVEAPAGFILDWALKVNDRGWIVGVGHYGPLWGSSRGFVLKPRGAETAGVEDGATHGSSLAILENPVAGRLRLSVTLPRGDFARISVFDPAGRRVALVHDGFLNRGTHALAWSAAGRPPGVYVVRLETPEGGATAKRFAVLR